MSKITICELKVKHLNFDIIQAPQLYFYVNLCYNLINNELCQHPLGETTKFQLQLINGGKKNDASA